MKLQRYIPLILTLLAILAASCGGDKTDLAEPRAVELTNLYTAPADSAILAARDVWIAATRGIIPATAAERDSLLAVEEATDGYLLFSHDVENRWPDIKPALTALARLDSFPRRIYHVISPFNQSVVISDTIVLLALNHYLGIDYPGYQSFPEYVRRGKSARRVAYDVGEAWLRARYPFPDSIVAPTLLQRMAYEGAILAELSEELGDADRATLLGWTAEELADVGANERRAWDTLVGREMLFSDDPALTSRLINPAPSSPDISPDAPGRLGRYLGLRIIETSGQSPDAILASRAYLDPAIIEGYARRR